MGKLIALEGTPGAGKTTVWKRLQNEAFQGFPVYFAPVLIEPAQWSSVQKYQSRDVITLIDRWYLDEERKRADFLRQRLLSGTHVVQDRSFVSTLCYAFARSVWLKDESYFNAFREIFLSEYHDHILMPDIVVSLLVPPAISLQRVSRNDTVRAVGPWTSQKFIIAWHEFVRDYARSFLPVDTTFIELDVSQLTVEDTYCQMKELLYNVVALT